jgi:hypothetical protein
LALGEDARDAIGAVIRRKIPTDAFVAMDYTLDWLFAATRWTLDTAACNQPQSWPDDRALTASQEDVDLVVAWDDREGPHMVLFEAKGFTGWSNKQMASKAKRLDAIFRGTLARHFDVHFILVGPAPSKGLKTQSWPDWMKPGQRTHFLPINDPGPKLAVQRCDGKGIGMKKEKPPAHWRSIPRTWTKATRQRQAPIEQ